ncbi:MAG: hypothetical protein KGI59_01160, partial [Patescibacteria group bacterium]|nr:hypothetical protein [Patescibacteria group bacterium]
MTMNFNNAKKDIRRLTMTAHEKQAMLTQIVGEQTAAVSSNARTLNTPVVSPFSFFRYISNHRLASSIVAAVLIMALAGGGVTYAAEGSLPGDPLYSLKTQVVEPLKVALAPTAAAKAAVQADLAQTRLAEAETLAVNGRLDTPKQQQISALLRSYTADLSQTLVQVRHQSPERAEAISANFDASMNAHADVLQTLAGTTTATTTVTVLSADAQAAAKTITPGRHGGASFKAKRNAVQTLIQAASSTLRAVATSSSVENDLIQQAQTAVEHASRSLQQADQQDSGGTSSPDDSLRQSRISADEANILL